MVKSLDQNRVVDPTQIDHYSYSTFVKFCTNPIMFKVQYINGDRISSTSNVSGVIGKAFHSGMEAFYGVMHQTNDESAAAEAGLKAIMEYLDVYNEGWIEYSETIPNRGKMNEMAATAYKFYLEAKKPSQDQLVACEEQIELYIDIMRGDQRINLPVKLKGYIDKIIRQDGKLKIVDYKTSRTFSDPDKIDGKKIIQAVQYYLLVYAMTGEEPYSIIFEEVKMTKNRDGGSQVKEYEMVYSEMDQFFQFYFRLHDDMTAAIFENKMVYVPNIDTFFDNEVSIVSYIHHLDEKAVLNEEMKKEKVTDITDLLKKKLANAGSMKKFLAAAEKKFVSAKSLNYDKMKIEERIQTKLMEHGMVIRFDSKVDGYSFDLYRYSPSIGLKMSKIMSYVADIEQVIGVSGVRILAPIPGTTFIGFEVPRAERRFPDKMPQGKGLEIAVGADMYGQPYYFDIRKAPHMLIAGATGSGKSVFINSMIEQIMTDKKTELYLFDPKMVELSRYRKAAKVYSHDPIKIHEHLRMLVDEMNNRYEIMADKGARNIEECGGFNYIVAIIDEFGDLAIGNYTQENSVVVGKIGRKTKTKVERTNVSAEIMRSMLILAQKARAAGIHLVIATQRPSTDIISGSVKANFPTKVAFRTAKEVDSRVLLDEAGAEKLLGKGDMIFSSDAGQIRLQGYNA